MPSIEKAIIVGLVNQKQDSLQTQEFLDELAFLALTSGAKVVNRFTQRLNQPLPNTFIGKGKLGVIKDFVKEHHIDLVIFDDDLTATQLRNIERILSCKILDRSNLILDIFASRARTAHAKTQVELAQYQYLLPRLTRMWTHLERQKGGIGMRGPGETQIETDRRIINKKIGQLKLKLEKIDKQKFIQRKNRGNSIRVALVGYTNVGKSTIMNLLSKSDVFAENKLFATLDTTVRKVVINQVPFLLSDTVGFIRKLPHQLVESFKSTLDEVREADVLIHVVDVSHPSYQDQVDSVNETLNELLDQPKPLLICFNKMDNINVEVLQAVMNENRKSEHEFVFISAIKKLKIDEFRQKLFQIVEKLHFTRFPFNTTVIN
ncbi:MAG: GTPase HflX [Bacteroidota bacterium]|nr:GTPase HflX [Bacteroidota bacterium]